MKTVGMALVEGLRKRGVEVVFGIPGVHTIELYRGLSGSPIRHVTPRHEQGASFMADGYARMSGKPGVAFVITGPGLTNALTAMAQARADSVPILVISGVNRMESHGKPGCIHIADNTRQALGDAYTASDRGEIEVKGKGPMRTWFLEGRSGNGPSGLQQQIARARLPSSALKK